MRLTFSVLVVAFLLVVAFTVRFEFLLFALTDMNRRDAVREMCQDRLPPAYVIALNPEYWSVWQPDHLVLLCASRRIDQ